MSGKGIIVLVTLVAHGAIGDTSAQPVADLGLYDAIRTAQLEDVQAYLAEGGDPNGVIEGSPLAGARPLKVAAYGQGESIVVALLRAGARMDLAEISLPDLSQAGMDEALSILLADSEMPEDLSAIQDAVESAVAFGHFDATAVLLMHLRTTDAVPSDLLWDAMNRSIDRGYNDIARLLLENGAPASGAALRAASLRSSPGMVRYLLSLGADPSEQYRDPLARPQGRNGFTAIEYAWDGYRKGTPAQQQLARFKIYDLQAAGATSTRFDANSLAVDGDSLLSKMTDPTEKLLRATEWGFYDTVRALLDARMVRDAAVLTEATVLAIDIGWDDIARLLLEEGAPPEGGPLHMAVRRSSPGLVRHLLELGADPNELVNGFTAAEYWWQENPAAPPDTAPRPRAGGDRGVLYELIVHGAEVCWLGQHRDRLAEYNGFALVTLLNTASDCWPEQ